MISHQEKLRVTCLELAINWRNGDVLITANRFYEYIVGKKSESERIVPKKTAKKGK